MVQVPEESARTALGMARAMSRADDEGARHLWSTAEDQGQVAQALAVLLANLVAGLSKASGQPPEHFYNQMQQGIDSNPG